MPTRTTSRTTRHLGLPLLIALAIVALSAPSAPGQTATPTVTPSPATTPVPAELSRNADDYVLLALDDLRVKDFTFVVPGNVGVNNPGGTLRFGRSSSFPDGSQLAADVVKGVGRGSSLWDVFANRVNLRSLTRVTIRHQGPLPIVPLPIIDAIPALPPCVPSGLDIDVASGTTVALVAGSYASIRVRSGGTLVLSGGVYCIGRLQVDRSPRGGTLRTSVLVEASSEISIAERLTINVGAFVGPAPGTGLTAQAIRLKIAGTRVTISHQSEVRAFILAPRARLRLGRRAILIGQAIALQIRADRGIVLTLESRKIKVVPIKWCLIDDGTGGTTTPNGRFSPSLRMAALDGKNLLWGQCDIEFAVQGPQVTIPDPDPAGPGDVGDLLFTRNDREELQRARDACDAEIGDAATEKLVEIIAKGFVNQSNRPASFLGESTFPTDGVCVGGASDARPCRTDGGAEQCPDGACRLVRPRVVQPGKAVVKDPEAYGVFDVPTPGVTPTPRSSFVRSLAHENGHALSLKHPPGMPSDRLMSQTQFGGVSGRTLSRDECKHAREVADRISGRRVKDPSGERIFEASVRSREVIDARAEVSVQWVDVTSVVAVRGIDNALNLRMNLGGLIPAAPAGLRYVFLVDVDGNTGTGGVPVLGFACGLSGTELVVEVLVDIVNGVRTTVVVVHRFQAAGRCVGSPNAGDVCVVDGDCPGGSCEHFLPLADPRIAGAVVAVLAFHDTPGPLCVGGANDSVGCTADSECPGGQCLTTPDTQPVYDSIQFALPADLLPVPLVDGFRVAACAYDPFTLGGVVDQAPVLIGAVTAFPEPTFVRIAPVSGPVGTVVAVSGEGFSPSASVDVFLGTQLVASGTTNALGEFAGLQFVVPAPTSETFTITGDGRTIGSVTAVDANFLSDAMVFELTP